MFDSALKIVSFIIGWIATIITILCYLPQTIKTLISKNTYSLSKWFFILGFGSSFIWIILGIISIFTNIDDGIDISNSLLISLPVIVTNVIGVISNLIVLYIKIMNRVKANRENISEKEYCIKYYSDSKSKRIDDL